MSQALADARPRVIAALAAQFGDLDLAEEAFGDALEALLGRGEEVRDPVGWLVVAARRKGIDIIRRRKAEGKALAASALEQDMAEIITLPDPIPDERLRLLFTCCHPALGVEARASLALKVICGVAVGDIARVFLTSEPTMYQRITRAKAKIREANVPFETPPRRDWPERIEAVLLALELAFTLAYQDGAGEGVNAELGLEVERLASILAELVPEEPEVLGFLALVRLAASRSKARVDADGVMVPLSKQDATLWDGTRIESARGLLDKAAETERSGPYQIMAAIQLTHARRYFAGETDWQSIARLYEVLLALRPDRVVQVNRALALGQCEGAAAGLAELRALDVRRLENFRPYHAALARLSEQVGDSETAKEAYRAALRCDPPKAERAFLKQRLAALG